MRRPSNNELLAVMVLEQRMVTSCCRAPITQDTQFAASPKLAVACSACGGPANVSLETETDRFKRELREAHAAPE